MNSLAQTYINSTTHPLVIGDLFIRQDEDGRYCLNDLHKASGDTRKDRPSYFLENEKTQELIKTIDDENYDVGNPSSFKRAVNIIRGRGKEQGTYAVKELVYSYAMWISAKFHLTVIRAYDAMVMQWQINDRKSISPEQQALLHEIVARRSNGERKIYAEMWSRHNRHFKIAKYNQLLSVHFSEAVHYLETMDIKSKAFKNENLMQIPLKPQVLNIASQISHSWVQTERQSWFVEADPNGSLSVIVLPQGFYPFNVVEFTKHFDGVLNILASSDILRVGRYLLSEQKSSK